MKYEWDYGKNGIIIVAIDRVRVPGWFRSVSSMRRKYAGKKVCRGSWIFWRWNEKKN